MFCLQSKWQTSGCIINNEDSAFELLTWKDEGKSTMWHSSAHLMAEALEQLYPELSWLLALLYKRVLL